MPEKFQQLRDINYGRTARPIAHFEFPWCAVFPDVAAKVFVVAKPKVGDWEVNNRHELRSLVVGLFIGRKIYERLICIAAFAELDHATKNRLPCFAFFLQIEAFPHVAAWLFAAGASQHSIVAAKILYDLYDIASPARLLALGIPAINLPHHEESPDGITYHPRSGPRLLSGSMHTADSDKAQDRSGEEEKLANYAEDIDCEGQVF